MTADTIAAVKTEFVKLMPRAGAALCSALPWLTEADATLAIQSIELQLNALWPVANPSRAARDVLSRPEFSSMCLNAGRDFPRFIEVLFEGLRSMKTNRTKPAATALRRGPARPRGHARVDGGRRKVSPLRGRRR